MDVRRVVTGKTPDGKSVFVSDGLIETIRPSLSPGAEFHTIWGSDSVVQLPSDGQMPSFTQWFPPPGGFRVGFFTVAPANAPAPQVTDMNAALAEFEQKMPGLLGHMEPGAPGMHTTNTIDVEIVISGEVWLELDDGVEKRLGPGDTIVHRCLSRQAMRPLTNSSTSSTPPGRPTTLTGSRTCSHPTAPMSS